MAYSKNVARDHDEAMVVLIADKHDAKTPTQADRFESRAIGVAKF